MIRKRIRINKDGVEVVSYQAIARVKGYPEKVKTFRLEKEAIRWETKTKAAMFDGSFRDDKAVKDKTLAEAIDRLLEDPFFLSKKDWKTNEGHLRYWRKELGKYALSKLTPDLIAKKRDELVQEVTVRGKLRSYASANRYLTSLSGLFRVALEEWRWINENPLRFVRKLKEPRGRTRFLSDEERQCLLEVCKKSKSSYLYPVVILALATGMRRGEILKLTWSNVDLQTGKVTLHETKNGERRVVYVTSHALEILQQHAESFMFQSPFLFSNKHGVKPVDITQSWQHAVNQAQLEDFKFHDLRHSAASYLAMNGASPSEIAEILGHKTLAMVKRYAHLSESHSKGVLEKMNERMFGIV